MLTHRRCLRADHLSLDSRGNSFALIQRQAERLRNRPILPFYSSHLDLGRWFACLGNKFHPPNQLRHSAVSLPKARSLAFKNLLAPHDFACSHPLGWLRKLSSAATEAGRTAIARLLSTLPEAIAGPMKGDVPVRFADSGFQCQAVEVHQVRLKLAVNLRQIHAFCRELDVAGPNHNAESHG